MIDWELGETIDLERDVDAILEAGVTKYEDEQDRKLHAATEDPEWAELEAMEAAELEAERANEPFACGSCGAEFEDAPIDCALCGDVFCCDDCHADIHDLEAEEERDREKPKAPARWYVCTQCGSHVGMGADTKPTRCFTCGGALKPEPEETEVDITW